MKIIHNIIPNTHHKRILDLLKISDEIFIVSPFLIPDFGTLINKESLNKLKKISLITTLKTRTPDQICKVSSLYSLIKNYKHLKNLSIYIDNKLHAKVYIFKKNNKYVSGIISSANFTWQGQTTNHETGVELFDESMLKKLESAFIYQKGVKKFDLMKIDKMKVEVDNYLEKNKQPKDEKIALDLSKYLPDIPKEETITYWLKPLGVTEDPVTEDRIFNKLNEKLYFSKKRPSGVRIGDIMIAYGVGPTKILSIYKVKSRPIPLDPKIIKKFPGRARWPWYVLGENLTPHYGEVWANNELRLNNLKDDFMKDDSTRVITLAGGNSFGAFNRGLDKLRLRKEFAEYVIGRVTQLNNE